MSVKDIARHTPYLRRYARALTGSQSEGDGFVEATLERLLGGGVELASDLAPRVALFRAFHQTWRLSLNGHSIDSPHREVADQRLQTLTPEHRTALLLMLMEGFSPQDVADILQAPPATVEARFRAAQEDIERQLATRVLIIEDEPIVALDLERLVQDLGHRLTGVAATRTEAVKMAHDDEPGLVLADVRLADGSSGLEAASDILRSFDIPVIFITAFPERLLTGERPEPAFVVSKPFHEETVKALIGQALFFHKPQRRAVA
jgi:DNA-directed RNA polymerase specialized sigma24 family protein